MFQNENIAWLTLLVAIWTIPWKGVALWKAAQLSHKKWFIAILILNTLAILEIFYIFYVAKKYSVKVEEE
ncbi:MAG: DUF5652 family protein [Candidatus Pacebacteria bacterium]|nr:DUF5652 family protein [Candidatus Paceibacterota bacterium]